MLVSTVAESSADDGQPCAKKQKMQARSSRLYAARLAKQVSTSSIDRLLLMIHLLLHQPPPAASDAWTDSLNYVDPLEECESNNGDSDAEEFTEEKEQEVFDDYCSLISRYTLHDGSVVDGKL